MEEADNSSPTKILEKNYNSIKKNGKMYFLISLAIIPGLCFSSLNIHTIKIGASDKLRCKINSLENTSWKFEEIREISHPLGIHKECYIYNYSYDKLVQMTLIEAKKHVDKNEINTTQKICTSFVPNENSLMLLTYPKEFANYCESLNYEILYDLVVILPYILGCLLLTPLGDVYGRKSNLSMGCHLMYLAVFVKIMMLDFTREVFGDIIANFGYSPLKYATEAIILETAGNELRPLAFVLTFIGLQLPLIGVFLPFIYWKYAKLLTYCSVLLLPLFLWYMPESSLWFLSRKKPKLAIFTAETLNDSGKHNDNLLLLRNRRITFGDVKNHAKELKNAKQKNFGAINAICVGLGFLSYYSYTKTKLKYANLDHKWLKIFYYTSGFLSIILSIPCVYLMDRVKFLLAALFCISGTLYTVLYFFTCTGALDRYLIPIVILTSLIDISSVLVQILFEFYLHKTFPTSHRCTCTGICGATKNLGLLIIICLRRIKAFTYASELLISAACFTCCATSVLLIKNSKRTASLLLNFDNEEQSN